MREKVYQDGLGRDQRSQAMKKKREDEEEAIKEREKKEKRKKKECKEIHGQKWLLPLVKIPFFFFFFFFWRSFFAVTARRSSITHKAVVTRPREKYPDVPPSS